MEDEALRGDLEDVAFGPLINVVSEIAIARGGRFTDTDELYRDLRGLLMGAVEAVESGDRTALVDALEPPLASASECRDLAAILPDLGDSQADNAAWVAEALAAVLLSDDEARPMLTGEA